MGGELARGGGELSQVGGELSQMDGGNGGGEFGRGFFENGEMEFPLYNINMIFHGSIDLRVKWRH